MKKAHSQNSINELEFRILFKKEYGIDYLDALDKFKQFKQENERSWNQLLLKHRLI